MEDSDDFVVEVDTKPNSGLASAREDLSVDKEEGSSIKQPRHEPDVKMVPLAELIKIRAKAREFKAQRDAYAKIIGASRDNEAKKDPEDFVTFKDLQRVEQAGETIPSRSVTRYSRDELIEFENNMRELVPDFEAVIKKTEGVISKDTTLISAIMNSDDPAWTAYEVGRMILSGEKNNSNNFPQPTPRETPNESREEKMERIEFNQSLPKNVSSSPGTRNRTLHYSATEIAAMNQGDFNELWNKMTDAQKEKLKMSIQVPGAATKTPREGF